MSHSSLALHEGEVYSENQRRSYSQTPFQAVLVVDGSLSRLRNRDFAHRYPSKGSCNLGLARKE